MSSLGFGICGHKNSYSTGVKLGNYVEDRVGTRLAATTRSHPLNHESEASSNYINPKDTIDKCAHAPQDDLVERALIRAGLPYNLIFEHGVAHLPTSDELTSKYTLASSEIGRVVVKSTTRSSEPSIYQQREMKRAREARELRQPFVTSTQAMIPATLKH